MKLSQCLLIVSLLFLFSNCKKEQKTYRGNASILPKPQLLELGSGAFHLNPETTLIPQGDPAWEQPLSFLNKLFERAAGCHLNIGDDAKVQNAIIFSKDPLIREEEGYRVTINPSRIEIAAKTPAGAFYGVQTLLQMMPPEIYLEESYNNLSFDLPVVNIVDAPRFSYRGMHLDVCRHFYDVDDVKRYIDLLAMHKFNRFHWHLTEDQGWRIEIKKYPRLTEVAAFRSETLIGHYNDEPQKFDGKKYGGFYTQKEIKAIVKYAAERYITIIPEIELPGHAQAAIAAYPELGCLQDTVLQPLTKWGISDNVYCPTEETFQFLENVLTEVMELFPGEYIHIGGDECPKTQWKESEFVQDLMVEKQLKDEHAVQSYFIKRIEKFINSKGKKIIGWDEILEGGLAPNATVMSWRGTKGGIAAAKAGHKVIMTPTSHCYFDYYQSQHEKEPLAIGGFLPLEKVYNYDPIPKELSKKQRKLIIGAQGNLWTEYISNRDKLDYMTYPRACAMAEVNWTNSKNKSFPDFVKRLETHLKRLEHYGVNFSQNVYDVKGDFKIENGLLMLHLKSNIRDAEIKYSLGQPKGKGPFETYSEPINVSELDKVWAQQFVDGVPKGRDFFSNINWHKAAGKSIGLKNKPATQYSAAGNASIANGVLGSNERYGDKEWLGFAGKDFEAVIDMGDSTSISAVKLRFFKGEGQWIYLPKKISVFTSENGKKYSLAAATANIYADDKIATPSLKFKSESRYLKIVAERFGIIPDGAQGAGNEAWLFVDEVVVE